MLFANPLAGTNCQVGWSEGFYPGAPTHTMSQNHLAFCRCVDINTLSQHFIAICVEPKDCPTH